MWLKAPVFSPDYRGSSSMQVRGGPWTMIWFLAVDFQHWSSSLRHERAFRRPDLSPSGSPGPEGTHSPWKGPRSGSVSPCIPSLSLRPGETCQCSLRSLGMLLLTQQRAPGLFQSSPWATGSADWLLPAVRTAQTPTRAQTAPGV